MTKESAPDTRAIVFQTQEKLDYELSELSMLIKHLDNVKKEKEEAKPCGHCEYCKSKALSQRVEVV
ncbi:TPA: PD-(D/E)XK nuclease-like domain-containing protein [Streptococcus pneumoniae]